MNKFYKGSFYPEALKDVYISAGSWPENGADVDDETMAIYTGVAPEGKTLGADKNGNPAWIDIPPLSAEQQIIQAEQKRTVLRSMADAGDVGLRCILPLGKKEVRKDRRLIKCLEKSILTVMQMLKAQWLSRDRKKASATC
ncbi:TPA: tail fiber assembly protein [Escherichia coli]